MKKSIAVSIATMVFGAASLLAHHGYAEYDRNAPVSLEGTVKSVLWANPHILVLLETKDKVDYSVEFSAPGNIERRHVEKSTFLKVGDYVLIKGSINRNPEKKILTMIREVHRPSDGWELIFPFTPTPAK